MLSAPRLWFLALLALLPGCVSRRAFVDLPREHRQNVEFISAQHRPRLRFASEGARAAREYGGLIPLAIAWGIEGSTNAYGAAAGTIGTFESDLIERLFLARVQALGINSTNWTNAARLDVRLHTVGLREVERNRFATFAHASARLLDSNGEEIWSAHAKAVGTQLRPAKAFTENADAYRQDFTEPAEDVVEQLVYGPIRPINF